jgi:RNA polymerase sigma-70 factor (ECF subfamily)
MQPALFEVRRDGPAREPEREKPALSVSFTELVERHSRILYRIALSVVRQPDDAEDVVQEAFLQVYRGERWRQMEDERGYLAQVVWRLAVRQHKRKGREQELPIDIRSARPGPEQRAIDRQLEQWLHRQIDALPEKLRIPLALAALGELKLVEIAKILGLPEGTVRRRIHDARTRLRQQLNEQKGGGSEQGHSS